MEIYITPESLLVTVILSILVGIIGYYLGREKALRDIDFEVVPICRVSQVGLPFWKSTTVKYGYQFQLFIKGIPAVKTEETIIGEKEVKEVNEEQLKALVRESVRVALHVQTGGATAAIGAATALAQKVLKLDETKLAELIH